MRRNKRFYRRPDPGASMYAIKGGDFIKFGFAARPVERLGELQVGSPLTLTLIAELRMPDQPSAMALEKAIHLAIARFHARGEWFNSCPRTLALAAFMDRGAAEFERIVREWCASEAHYLSKTELSPMFGTLRNLIR